ncbi:hypothetical protein SAMN00790413_01904 [Deinococcus hopiensis KR-140]|uniref:Uncharacterized protein n=1 Tax=Deinococcus hopiensis KR-140 TaxID=695939 RepID=A0A1W1VIN1_9DEIO|nr:hypothetical protein SAMN00790413_01904 [Deinococcus hopiensis KR-140]
MFATAEYVITPSGRHPHPLGAPIRPGETVTVDGEGSIVGIKTSSRPVTLPRRDDVFVVPASFDTPQRPGIWGGDHLPGSTNAGVFVGSGGGVRADPVMTLDSGDQRIFTAPFVVDHAARRARFWQGGTTTRQAEAQLHGVPSNQAPTGWNPDDTRFLFHTLASLDAGIASRPYFLTTWRYDGTDGIDAPVTMTTSGLVTTFRLQTGGAVILSYRLIDRWGVLWPGDDPSNSSTLWQREWQVQFLAPVVEGGDEIWQNVSSNLAAATREEWALNGTPVPPDPNPVSWTVRFESDHLAAQTWPSEPAPPPLPSPRWKSEDGSVTVTGPPTMDHDVLETGAALSAYGHTFSLGSWGAMCGPMDSTGQAEAWVLHEDEGNISRVKDNGMVDVLDREVFEREVLRCPEGAFKRFLGLGLLSHTWPHWAFALCQTGVGATLQQEVRAVTLHDPWRDSIKGKRPSTGTPPPAHWYWPARPGKRPKTMPSTAPVAPLGLTLADVFTAGVGGDGGQS